MMTTLRRPAQVHHVDSPEAYRRFQRAVLAHNFDAGKGRTREPWICPVSRPVYVAMGKWLIRCVCGNAPSVDPSWRLACCIECGAVFEGLDVPAEYEAIEAVLLERPVIGTQAMHAGETLEQLKAENRAHGIAVPTRCNGGAV